MNNKERATYKRTIETQSAQLRALRNQQPKFNWYHIIISSFVTALIVVVIPELVYYL